MFVSHHARFVAYLATAARQRKILMSEMLVMIPGRGIFSRRREIRLPPDMDTAAFHLSTWMVYNWGMKQAEALERTDHLCEDLLCRRREAPTLQAFDCEPDELATRIAFLAALCNYDWAVLSGVRLLFERPGLRLACSDSRVVSEPVELALKDLQEQLAPHQRKGAAERQIACLRGRIETRNVTCETIDRALEPINPS